MSQLEDLSQKQLIDKINSMQKHIDQLKNIIGKKQNGSAHRPKSLSIKKRKKEKEFDFSKCNFRYVFLKFLYFGWNYDGFVLQEDTINTVERVLFDALIKTKLIRNRETSNYNRCGRTDKSVSAFCQVVSLYLRSKPKENSCFAKNSENSDDLKSIIHPNDEEMDYISILNGVLPENIRVMAWAPIASNLINARFDCIRRVYHYYFSKDNLDINEMQKACQLLVGEHDFRNFCKLDVNNGIKNYLKKVYSASIEISNIHSTSNGEHVIYVFRIEASSFLWHQIRCIMAVLFYIGQRLESSNIITQLLNVEKYPSRPQYQIASGLPLVLYDAFYEDEKVSWFFGKNSDSIISTINLVQSQWNTKAMQCSMIQSMLDSLKKTCINQFQIKVTNTLFKELKNYKSLLQRPSCKSLEEKIEQMKYKKLKHQ